MAEFAYDSPTNYSELLAAGQIFQGIQISICAISFLMSSTVLLTAVMFPSMARNKIYMHMILMVSLNDALFALSGMLGFPAWNTLACPVQSSLGFFFMRGSWIWAVFILYQLDGIVYTGRLRLNRVCMQVTALAINTLLALAPVFYGQEYGLSKYYSGYTICSFVFEYGPGGTSDPSYSHTIATSFMGPMLLSLLVMVVLYVKMFLGLRNRRLVVEQNRALVKSVSLYPLVQMVCWMPFVCVMFNIFKDTPSANLPLIDYIPFQTLETWTYMSGIFSTIVFFRNSVEARERWTKVLRVWRKQFLGGGGGGNYSVDSMKSGLSGLNTIPSMQTHSRRGTEPEGGYEGEEDFLIDDEMIENIAVTEKEEHTRVSRLSRADSIAFSVTSAGTGAMSQRPSGLSVMSERSSADSGVEMQSWRSSGSSARSSGFALSAEGGAGGEGHGVGVGVDEEAAKEEPSSLHPAALSKGNLEAIRESRERNTSYTQTTLGSDTIPDTIPPMWRSGQR